MRATAHTTSEGAILGLDEVCAEMNNIPLRFSLHPEDATSATDRLGEQGFQPCASFQRTRRVDDSHRSGTAREDMKHVNNVLEQGSPSMQRQFSGTDTSLRDSSSLLEEIHFLRTDNTQLHARCSELERRVATLETVFREIQAAQQMMLPFDASTRSVPGEPHVLPCHREAGSINQVSQPQTHVLPSDRYMHPDRSSDASSPACEARRNSSETSRSLLSSAAASDQPRSTIMLRNLPNNYTSAMMMDLLNSKGFACKYNFFYMPIDFDSAAAFGYCFVNLVDPSDADLFWRTFENFSDWVIPSNKRAILSWSHPYQGLDANIDRYRNSPLMHHTVPEECKPQLLSNGVVIPFPQPTVKLRQPCRRSSASLAT